MTEPKFSPGQRVGIRCRECGSYDVVVEGIRDAEIEERFEVSKPDDYISTLTRCMGCQRFSRITEKLTERVKARLAKEADAGH